jgi:hypothetical protein
MPDATLTPRSFYCIGHNPDSIPQVQAALAAGANAIEPDVNAYADRPTELCIGEADILDPLHGCDPSAPALTDFLDALHGIAVQTPALTLVMFDCKPKIATADFGLTLLTEIRNRLTFDTGLNVILSVASRSEGAFFDKIRQGLGPREGLMVDEENDPVAISNFFADVSNRCYGNGIAVANSVLGPNVRPSMERACEFRAATGLLSFIYVWSVNDEERMRDYLRIGVDGFITDSLPTLNAVLQEEEFRSAFRPPTRLDNPFAYPNLAYGLAIYTGNLEGAGAGPDAHVQFTLTGAAGAASMVLDATLPDRLDQNSWTYVTLRTTDLGALQSLTVQFVPLGGSTNWYLDHIDVVSLRFGVSKVATFQRWIDASGPFTQQFA